MEKEDPQAIKKYANQYGWSDVYPYEVVRTISDITVEVRPMKSTQTKFPQQFHVGGFSAHCSDQHSQEWKCESIPDAAIIRIRWSRAKKKWFSAGGQKFIMEDKPSKFYDYNF